MEKFQIFQFNDNTFLFFTHIESEYDDDICKHFIFEFIVEKQSQIPDILLTERFEIFEWRIKDIIDKLNELHQFKIEQVDISNDEGQGVLSLELTENKKIDITFTTTEFGNINYDIKFKIQADQTIVKQFVLALCK